MNANEPGPGHNSPLKQFVTRIENLNDPRAGLTADIKSVYSEAKSAGFDPKIIRAVVKIRAEDEDKRQEFESLLDLYMAQVGQ